MTIQAQECAYRRRGEANDTKAKSPYDENKTTRQNAPKPKLAKCKVCRGPFEKRSMSHVCCCPDHAIEHVKRQREKAVAEKAKEDRKKDKARREKLKTRREYIKEAQIAFNSFIRERDMHRPCICCGAPLTSGSVSSGTGGEFDCGHYRSIGSAPHLRFDERNAHGQTKKCNRWGAGRAVDYRIGLIARIGLPAVEALEADNEPKKYSIDDLKAIRDEYKAKLKALKGGRDVPA